MWCIQKGVLGQADLSVMPSCSSKAHRERQKPWFGLTRLRRCLQCSRARLAGHVNRRIKYAMHSAAERLTPAPQCTNTPATPQPRSEFSQRNFLDSCEIFLSMCFCFLISLCVLLNSPRNMMYLWISRKCSRKGPHRNSESPTLSRQWVRVFSRQIQQDPQFPKTHAIKSQKQ
jgi:hypothetical protein